MLTSSNCRHAALVISLLFSSIISSAQFTIENPSYASKESSDITVRAIRIFPDSLVLDLSYYGNRSYDNPGFYINGTSKIEFVNGGDWEFANWSSRVSKLENAYYSSIMNVKKGSTHPFSVVFPFSFYKMMNRNDDAAFDFFGASDPFRINFINCDDNYRNQNNLRFGTCFDIYKLNLNMPFDNWAVIWCSGYLNEYFKKGEFETTAKYNARLAPDSVTKQLHKQIDELYLYFGYHYLGKIQSAKPDIVYSPDEETFSVKYPGFEKIIISVPIAAAPQFKKDVLDGTLSVTDVALAPMSNGSLVITHIEFEKKSTGKATLYQNKLSTGIRGEDILNRILALLRKNYTRFTGF